MKKPKNLTAAYSAVQGSFWMSFCVAVSFAAVYLQGLGYSNTELGAIMALGSLLGSLLGPALSALIDRHEHMSAAALLPPVFAAQAAMLVLLAVSPAKGAATTLGFVLYTGFCESANSLNLKLYIDLEHGGASVDYGFARGMGSLGYVLLSVALGAFIERRSVHVLPFVGFALCALQFLAHVSICRGLGAGGGAAEEARKRGAPMAAFMRGNRRFCVLLCGLALLFLAHNIAVNFLINVVRNIGGDTGTMGRVNGFMALMEVPVMMLFGRLRGKRSSVGILRFAFVCFVLKSAALAAAASVPALFAAFLLQAPSFALYTSAVVPYVGEIVPFEDQAKAQSLAFTMTTVGALLASVIGGRLYDAMSVTATLWAACAVCVAGAGVALAGVARREA